MKKRPAAAGILAALILTVLATVFCSVRYRALEYRPDLAFYLGFSARVLDAQLPAEQPFKVQGDNFLGYVGREGEAGLHQAIHFEPLKYLDAGLWWLLETAWPLFGWRALLHFLPLAYLGVIASGRPQGERASCLALGVLYAVFPSALFSVGYDLRPYGLLAPSLFLVLLSIQFARPFGEVLALLALLLLTREESLVLGGLAILYAAARAFPRREVLLLTGLWIAWGLVALRYFAWTGYENERDWVLWATLLGGLGASGLALLALSPRLRVRPGRAQVQVLVLAATSGVVLLQMLREAARGEVRGIDLLVHPRWILLLPGLLVFCAWLWERFDPSVRLRAAWATGVTAMALVAVSAFHADGALASFAHYRARGAEAGPVVRARSAADRLETVVLCDYHTCAAFADFARLVHLGTLEGQRGFPEELPRDPVARTRRLLAIEVVVVDARYRDEVARLLGSNLRVVEETPSFVTLRR